MIYFNWPLLEVDIQSHTSEGDCQVAKKAIKANNGFPRKSAYLLHYHHIKGTSPIDMLVWPLVLGTSMTPDITLNPIWNS